MPGVTNDAKYPFFVSLTCQDGYYLRPRYPAAANLSLTEALILPGGKGSVASFSSDSMTGDPQKLNDEIILSEGQQHGAVYNIADRVEPGKRFYYWLELVKPSGNDMGSPIIVDSKYFNALPGLFR